MSIKQYVSLLLIVVLLFTATSSCGKPGLPEESSLETVETIAPPPLNQTDGLTKPSDTAAGTYEHTAYNPFPYTEPDPALIINRQKELLKLIKNKTPYNDLITKTVDIYEFVQTFSPNPNILEFYPSLAVLDENIGVECIRRSKAGKYYSVHKLEQGGLLYIFYIDEQIKYLWMHNWFVVQKSLSYEDFSVISKGSSLEDVRVIDPVTEIYEQRVHSYKPGYNEYEENVSFYSQHYLTDGILTIHYTYTDAKWTVKYDEYRNNFQIDYIYNSGSPKYNGRILDIDAIQ